MWESENESSSELAEFAGRCEETASVLYSWACLRVPRVLRSRIDPEDVVQETFCRAFEQRASFDEERGAFRAWVFGIAANVVRKGMRRLRETPAAALDGGASALDLEGFPASLTTVSRRVARDEEMLAFVARLDELDEEERRLVVHRGLEERPLAEVAKLMGMEAAAVRKRWQRLRAKLEEIGPPIDLMPD